MYKRGSRLIDTIAATTGIMQVIEGCKLIETNEIVISDYHTYIIDVNLSNYFEEYFSQWNEINKSLLNSSRRLYCKKLVEELEEQIDIFQLEHQIDQIRYKLSPQQLEQIDQSITMILNKARKKVEGISRNIPYSKEKEVRRSAKLY